MLLLKYFGKLKKRRLFVRRIVGDSMAPSYKPGHIVVAVAHYRRLEPGDVVIVRHHGLEKIKRIQDIRSGQIFVVGDNLPHSTDSRSFGWLPNTLVIGKVCWPRVN